MQKQHVAVKLVTTESGLPYLPLLLYETITLIQDWVLRATINTMVGGVEDPKKKPAYVGKQEARR